MSKHVFRVLNRADRNWSSSTSFQTSTTISSLSSPASNLKVCARYPSKSVRPPPPPRRKTSLYQGVFLFHACCRRTHPFAEWPDPEEQRQGALPELPAQRGRLHQARMPEQHRRPFAAHQSYDRWVSGGGRQLEGRAQRRSCWSSFFSRCESG